MSKITTVPQDRDRVVLFLAQVLVWSSVLLAVVLVPFAHLIVLVVVGTLALLTLLMTMGHPHPRAALLHRAALVVLCTLPAAWVLMQHVLRR